MPRQLRLEFPDAMYHIMSRGDQREDIFLCDVDRYDFLKTLAPRDKNASQSPSLMLLYLTGLAEACRKTGWPREMNHEPEFATRTWTISRGWQIHDFCLMR